MRRTEVHNTLPWICIINHCHVVCCQEQFVSLWWLVIDLCMDTSEKPSIVSMTSFFSAIFSFCAVLGVVETHGGVARNPKGCILSGWCSYVKNLLRQKKKKSALKERKRDLLAFFFISIGINMYLQNDACAYKSAALHCDLHTRPDSVDLTVHVHAPVLTGDKFAPVHIPPPLPPSWLHENNSVLQMFSKLHFRRRNIDLV